MNASQRKKKYISFLDYINGGELFTHLSQRERFTEHEVQIYVGEIVLALEHLHKVRCFIFGVCFCLNSLLTEVLRELSKLMFSQVVLRIMKVTVFSFS